VIDEEFGLRVTEVVSSGEGAEPAPPAEPVAPDVVAPAPVA